MSPSRGGGLVRLVVDGALLRAGVNFGEVLGMGSPRVDQDQRQ